MLAVCHQGLSTFCCKIFAAASCARVAAVMASSTSSAEGPGVSALGYSKALRARRILAKDRNTGTEAPNCAPIASWIAMCPPLLL